VGLRGKSRGFRCQIWQCDGGQAVFDLGGEVNELVKGVETATDIGRVRAAAAFDGRFQAKAEQNELGFQVDTTSDADLGEEHLGVVSNRVGLRNSVGVQALGSYEIVVPILRVVIGEESGLGFLPSEFVRAGRVMVKVKKTIRSRTTKEIGQELGVLHVVDLTEQVQRVPPNFPPREFLIGNARPYGGVFLSSSSNEGY